MENEEIDAMDILNGFAAACADAYVSNYVSRDLVVSGHPIVTYDRKNGRFRWYSSLIPLNEEEVEVERLEQGMWGDNISDDATTAYEEIVRYLVSFADIDGLLGMMI